MARSTTGTNKMENSSIAGSFWDGAWSVAGWHDAGASGYLFVSDGGSGGGWHVLCGGGGKLVFTLAGVADYETTHNNPTTLFHFCVTYDAAGNAVVYLNGSASALSVGTLSTTTGGMVIGGTNRYGGLYSAGTYAEWAVWSSVLSAGHAASLAKAFSPKLVSPGTLENYWPIIGRMSPEPDVVGGGTLTLTGTANAAHPRVIYPRRRQAYSVAAAGGASVFSLDHIYRHVAGIGA